MGLLNKVKTFSNINFCLYEGEILGFAGLRGSGRTEILKSIAGIESIDSSKILLRNKELRSNNPVESFRNGIVYLPEDRNKESLFSYLSVKFNLVLNSFEKLGNKFFISNKLEEQLTDDLIKLFNIKATSKEQEVDKLSGGNRQKVIIGRVTASQPLIYLLDEPTRGVDIEAKISILRINRNKLCKKSSMDCTPPTRHI